MFRDIQLADWASIAAIAAIVAFVVSVAVFLFFVVGAIRMPKKKVRHDASLPLKDEKRQ